MEQSKLEEIYFNHCCDILPSNEDFPRMVEIGKIIVTGDTVTIYMDPEPEEDQCLYRCLRESSRLFDIHMKRMTQLTKEKKEIERKKRELDHTIWNNERRKRLQKRNR